MNGLSQLKMSGSTKPMFGQSIFASNGAPLFDAKTSTSPFASIFQAQNAQPSPNQPYTPFAHQASGMRQADGSFNMQAIEQDYAQRYPNVPFDQIATILGKKFKPPEATEADKPVNGRPYPSKATSMRASTNY